MLTDGAGVLADRYELQSVIGRGGMADVYLATDTVLEREVAVKVLRGHTTGDEERERFRDEAQMLGALDHPNLLSVLDAGIDEDVPYLVMDYVDGENLAKFCRGRTIPGHRVAAVGVALATVLSFVHARDIVHRDVKPSNILVGRDGVVRLADFGIARWLGDPAGQTAAGATTGTAAYIAPELVRGETATPASDIYSLGLVLLEALTGQRAYTGAPMEAALARLHSAPLIPSSLPTGWPSLLTQMVDADPERRPSADELVPVLRQLETVSTPSYGRRAGD